MIRSRTDSSSRPGTTDASTAARVLLREPSERQVRQADKLGLVARLANREHHRHGLRQQPSRDETEDLARGAVEPLRVLHQTEQRPFRGNLGQQAQSGQGNQEAVRSVAR